MTTGQKVVAVASQKGGSGKSTLTTALAVYFQRELGLSVRIVDADPQGTSAMWIKSAPDNMPYRDLRFSFCPGDATLHRRPLGKEKLILIDCPGRVDAVLRSALMVADLLLVPMQATYADAWALADLAEQLQRASELRDNPPPARVVLNRIRRGTRLAKRADQLADALPAGFTMLETRVRDLSDFQLALGEGQTPSDLNPRGAAADDVRALAVELRHHLWSDHE